MDQSPVPNRAARVLLAVDARWRSWALAVGGAIAVVVAATLVAVCWRVISEPVDGAEGLTAQASLLVAVAGLIVSIVLAATTIYYAALTGRLVREARMARLDDRERADSDRRASEARRMEMAGRALVGAASDAAGAAAVLATLLRFRRAGRARDAMQPLLTPVAAATRAVDELRYLAPANLLEAGQDLMDVILRMLHAGTTRRAGSELTRIAQELFEAKVTFEAALTSAVSAQEQNPPSSFLAKVSEVKQP